MKFGSGATVETNKITIDIDAMSRIQTLAVKQWVDSPIIKALEQSKVYNIALILTALESYLKSQQVDVPFTIKLG